MPAIHARNVGHMLADNYRGGKNGTTYTECPECGEDMHHAAAMCRDCRNAQSERERRAYTRPADEMDRHYRWGLAIEAGWTDAELCEMGPDALPTMEDIAARDIGVMIRAWRRAT